MKNKKETNTNLVNGKYYLYHLINNPDEFEYYGSMCANLFDLEMDNEDSKVTESYHLYGYCQDGELCDVVTGKKILNEKEMNSDYFDYDIPREWLAYSTAYLVEPIEVAEELKELIANNLVEAYAKKQEYVASMPIIKYEEKKQKTQELIDAVAFLENYRNRRGIK